MFNRSAHWYDDFYADVDYEAEAEQVAAVIRELNPGARSLLDVACGTGRHLTGFRIHFDCAGADIEPGMLAVAQKTLPGMPFTWPTWRHSTSVGASTRSRACSVPSAT